MNNESSSVDLTNCDKEPIRTPGRIQTFGALLVLDPDDTITHCSANIGSFLGILPEALLGKPAADILGSAVLDLIADLKLSSTYLEGQSVGSTSIRALANSAALFDVHLHWDDRQLFIELEPHSTNGHASADATAALVKLLNTIRASSALDELYSEVARVTRELVGFDRVMIYQFLTDGSGEVIAESRRDGVDSFMGLRYPASDIPKQARALYLKNTFRLIYDVHDPCAAILAHDGSAAQALDLSKVGLRAVSPIHVEYLRNMGVGASLSISIIRNGQLWGLIACHHMTPRSVPLKIRLAAELLGHAVSISAEQREAERETELLRRGRKLKSSAMAEVADTGSVSASITGLRAFFREVIEFDAMISCVDGNYTIDEGTLTLEQAQNLTHTLNRIATLGVVHSDCLTEFADRAHEYADRIAGMLSIPVSRKPRDYFILLRRPIEQEITWAGNPDKPVTLGPNGPRLQPRNSFAEYTQSVSGRSKPWTGAEIGAAESARITLLEVVLKISDRMAQQAIRTNEKQKLLINELNHRVRNILTLVTSLIDQSKNGGTVADFAKVISGRVYALARAHDQIDANAWRGASVKELIEHEVAAYFGEVEGRLQMTGDDVELMPDAYTTLALVIHELATNALKYGALSDRRGQIIVALGRRQDGALTLSWKERGGPPVSGVLKDGMGMTLIEQAIPFELRGEASLHFELGGVSGEFTIPENFIIERSTNDHVRPVVEQVDQKPKAPLPISIGKVMVLEDNLMVAVMLKRALIKCGADEVMVASNNEIALELLEAEEISLALLDVNLKDESSEPTASAMIEAGVPFAFVTGYSHVEDLSARFANVPHVIKPVALDDIAATVATLAAQRLSREG